MDIITITTLDGLVNEQLPDISYDKFVEDPRLFRQGASDVAYDNYLRENNMKFITDFNSETTLSEIILVVRNEYRGRTLKFKCIYDSDNSEEQNAQVSDTTDGDSKDKDK